MADFGPASNTPELQVGANATAPVFLEVHTANSISTPLTTGVPGGLAGQAAGLNNLGPTDFSGYDPGAYGSKPDGSAVTPQFNLGGTSAAGPTNPEGTANLQLFRFKNPS